jgi:hypothetical protein
MFAQLFFCSKFKKIITIMKKTWLFILGFTSILFALSAFKTTDKITAEKVLAKMYKRYTGKWYKNFTFTQITENFKNDSLIKTTTWYETIVFPDYFRISFGEPNEGNAVIYKKDSTYNFRKGKLLQKSLRTDDVTFLLGGMYFMPFDSVKTKMIKEGYDISKAHESIWEGKKVYVIGAETDDEKASQLWIDKEKLIVVRFVKYLPSMKQDARMSGHQQFGKAWSETIVVFYLNDKLYQKEKYNNCKVNTDVDMGIFDPYNFKSK